MGDRYHKAARDGYLGPLKEATRKDLNGPDEDGMTPTLWAAFHGHLEALQLICSRGGDPDMCDVWGNTCLHHAAINGHLHILSFLVNFGANVWALDVASRSALEAAAGKGRMECVRLLDGAVLRQTADNPRLATRRRERARKECTRRARDCERLQRKQQERMNKRLSRDEGAGVIAGAAEGDGAAPSLPGSGSLTLASLLKGSLHKKLGKKGSAGKIPGGRPGSDVIFAGQAVAVSPDSGPIQGEDPDDRESLFKRPGLGNMLFRRNFGPGLSEELDDIGSQTQPALLELGDSEEDQEVLGEEELDELPWKEQELGLDDEDVETTPLEVFLAAHNMSEFLPSLVQEHIDLDSLMLCSDVDLRTIHLPLGPRKKILSAVEKRKLILETSCELVDTML
ncbi:ankyrin repeat and SAM domain-containing protein 4B [Leucoraja erinacea]|uniref:ankyrin repeat and SAM domain-containing protein 4B n=1 Tax=Leucoraja erinaceus TaxID=7782 RepID=UPI00245829A2|nr:ankyrin repeat and SAM domain-containing protein 4B [Leucoraja erinacea]